MYLYEPPDESQRSSDCLKSNLIMETNYTNNNSKLHTNYTKQNTSGVVLMKW